MKNNLLIIFIILIITVILRLPCLWIPVLDVDETQFAGFANSILAGGLPYIDSVDTKPPGIYFLFALIFWLFGKNNLIAVHFITIIINTSTALVCYFITKEIHSKKAGLFAGILFAVFSTCGLPKLISTSIVSVMILPLSISVYLMLLWQKNKDLKYAFFSGIFLGIACLFKYQASINIIIISSYILMFKSLYKKDIPYKALITFLSGGFLLVNLLIIYLIRKEIIDAFIFWSIKGSLQYAKSTNGLINFKNDCSRNLLVFITTTFPLIFFTFYTFLLSFIRKPNKPDKTFNARFLIYLWVFLSIIPVYIGKRFYGHYFLQLYPALCVMSGIGLSDLLDKIKNKTYKNNIIIFIILITSFLATSSFIARLKIDKIIPLTDEENPKIYKPTGEYIKTHTKPGDKIFVWGFATPIYFYANRDSSSRFLWSDWITGRIAGISKSRDKNFDTTAYATPGSQDMLLEDLNTNKPIYFIDTSPGNYHNYNKYPVKKYPKLVKYLKYNYQIETYINNIYIYRRIKK